MFERVSSLVRAILQDTLGTSLDTAERGQRKSKFRNPASTVAFLGAVVDRPLAVDFEIVLTMRDRDWGARGVAWSNAKPGLGLGLKKQILSDCNLRNLRRVNEGTGLCRVVCIAVTKALPIVDR